jgi:putative addiction module component (TIGR02574 family)
MSNLAEKFIEEALMLPLADRAEIVDQLLQSLNVPSQSEIDQLWMEEAEKRISDYESKQVDKLEGENVIKEIRSRFKK